MNARTKALRAIVRTLRWPEFVWVRVWKDGTTNVGARNRRAMLDALRALEAAGYVCECNGKPGTSGEFTIDVKGEGR